MENISALEAFITEIGILLGVVVGIIVFLRKVADGIRCLLRSKMLEIYYRNEDVETIRQYEKENFVHLYDAYKALKGNSFVDDISDEVRTWKVIT